MKKLLLAFVILITSISVQANCLPEYAKAAPHHTKSAVSMAATIFGLPVSIATGYEVYQLKKMAKLIKESVNKELSGKITLGLHKSLLGEYSKEYIQEKVRKMNKTKTFCSYNRGQPHEVMLYRNFKNWLRWLIDHKREGKGKQALWP